MMADTSATTTRQVLFREKAEYVSYGCRGGGKFCSLDCAYRWASIKLAPEKGDA